MLQYSLNRIDYDSMDFIFHCTILITLLTHLALFQFSKTSCGNQKSSNFIE